MQNQRLPRGEKAWKKYWKEWEKLAKPHHDRDWETFGFAF